MSGVLTRPYRQAIAQKRVRPIPPPEPYYVNTVTGTAGGDGSVASPQSNMATAIAATAGWPEWDIDVYADEAHPIRQENIYDSSQNVFIHGHGGGQFFAYGSDVHNSGWVLESGTTWKKTLSFTACNGVTIADIAQTLPEYPDRTFQLKLIENTTTPTTPAHYEFGYTGGVMRMNLDFDPNGHQVECRRRNTAFSTRGPGRLNISDLVGYHCLTTALTCGLTGRQRGSGKLTATDCNMGYSNNGIGGIGQSEGIDCIACTGERLDNDGFNLHGTAGFTWVLMRLFGCETYCSGDVVNQSSQGTSNHEDTTIEVYGGRFDGCVSGGMVVIDRARCDLHGETEEWGPILMDRNMRLGNSTPGSTIAKQANCAWMDATKGDVFGTVVVSNGKGTGVRVVASTGALVNGADTIDSFGHLAGDYVVN